VFGTYTDQNYRARTPAEDHADKQTPSQEKEYGFAIGGPIIQDQMHFFLSYEAKRFDTPITVTPSTTSSAFDVIAALPANIRSQFGPAGLPFDEDLYFAKIDWELSDRDRFELSSKVRKEDQTQNVGVGVAASAGMKE